MTATLQNVAAYLVGISCTWHGPEFAANTTTVNYGQALSGVTTWYCCPHCNGALHEVSREVMYAEARKFGEDYEAMLRWSVGKCFPDRDTLQNAYRQAVMAEQGDAA